MTEGPEGETDRLRRVMALTPIGRQELRDPQSGLSLPQRWLLGHLDGESSLGDLAVLPGSPAADRLPRDAARLASLGLAVDLGEPGPTASSFGPSTLYGEVTLTLPLDGPVGTPLAADEQAGAAPATPRRRAPAMVLGVALAAVGGGAAYLASRGPDKAADRGTAAATLSTPAAAAQAVSASMASAALAASRLASSGAPASGVSVAAAPASAAASTTVLPAPAVVAAVSTPPVAPPPPALRAALVDGAAVRAPAVTLPATTARASTAPTPVAAPGPSPSRAVPEPPPAAPPALPAPAPQPATVVPTAAPLPLPAAQPTVAPAPAPPPPPAPIPAPIPPPAAPLVVAAASAAAPAAPLRPVTLVEPAFPREGLGLGSRAVMVQARLVVAPNGSVSQVSFPQSSTTTRVFERAARSALLQWKFPEGAGERIVLQQLRFSEE